MSLDSAIRQRQSKMCVMCSSSDVGYVGLGDVGLVAMCVIFFPFGSASASMTRRRRRMKGHNGGIMGA